MFSLIPAVLLLSRISSEGLFFDSALYSGLAFAISEGADPWLVRGMSFFQQFYEHPPFMFHWGALVFKCLGAYDWSARWVGAIPVAITSVFFIKSLFEMAGWSRTFLWALLLLSLGAWTKINGTFMLDAVLGAGILLHFVGVWRVFKYSSWKNYLMIFLGALLAASAKGVVALGLIGALVLSSFCLKFILREFWSTKKLSILICLTILGLILPFAIWYYKLNIVDGGHQWWQGYWQHQVFKSFTTNRGDQMAQTQWWAYLPILSKDFIPVLIVVLFFWGARRQSIWAKMSLLTGAQRLWLGLGISYVLAFVIPFSISQFKLPHYLIPLYPILVSLIIVSMKDFDFSLLQSKSKLRWFSLVFFLVMFNVFNQGFPNNRERGKVYAMVRKDIEKLSPSCVLYLRGPIENFYAQEAFGLWYFRGHQFSFLSLDPIQNQLGPSYAIFHVESGIIENHCQ